MDHKEVDEQFKRNSGHRYDITSLQDIDGEEDAVGLHESKRYTWNTGN
jgi:hypothetical protein